MIINRIMVVFLVLSLSHIVTGQQTHYNVTYGNGNGLRFWNSDSYKIHMGNSSEYKLGPVTDYSIKMNMNTTAGRGWTWGTSGATPVAALSNTGEFQVAKSFRFNQGGGFFMSDATWIRTYGNKNLYHNTGIMRTDGRFEVGPSGNRFTVTTSSNVGIGTTAPKEKLHIEGNLLIDSYSLGNGNGLFFREDHTSNYPYNASILVYDHNNGGVSPDGLSINGYDGVSFCTGGNQRNERMRILTNGNVAIGTTDPQGYKLAVAGKAIATEIKVKLQAAWPDYVFNETYELPTLEAVAEHITEKGHLPNIPSAKEVAEDGIYLGEMNAKLLEKIEELTLYTIQQEKKLEQQQQEILELKGVKAKNKDLEARLARIEVLLQKVKPLN